MKFREVIVARLAKEGLTPSSLPRSWDDVLWEQVSDELSDFFSNSIGLPAAPSAKALLVSHSPVTSLGH